MADWPLLLRSSLGNVFPLGRWSYASLVLIADAVNGGDWSEVEDFASSEPWDDLTAC